MRNIFGFFQVISMVLLASAVTAQVRQITPDVAREMALAGEIVLIDIREPFEWQQTGLPDVALTAAMRSDNFIETLIAIRNQNPDIPLALFCRTANRSGAVTRQLYDAGLTDVIDVIEGIAGSADGPGWAARGLPVRAIDEPVNAAILTVQP
ncbi:MAG: rhodanese-like domain-containing protein [Rhodobacteraceae bacterium]|nr:rhodanese-like domain-containing protein [Paracoccaceae bacterium]